MVKWNSAVDRVGRPFCRPFRAVRMAWRGWGVILLYHRIAAPALDPQLLCVTPDHFREHLDVLSRHFSPRSLPELSASVQNRQIPPWSVAITFDDGYADNWRTAAPILRAYDMRATVFVTGQVLEGKEFYYDVLEDVLLHTRALPEVLRFSRKGEEKIWRLGKWATWPEEPDDSYWKWNLGIKTNPTPRHSAYREIFTWLRGADAKVREEVIRDLKEMAGPGVYQPSAPRGVRREDLQAAEASDVLEIGAHSITHPVFSKLPPEAQQEEMAESKSILERIVGHPVTSFSYPFGSSWDVGPEALRIAEKIGFERSCANVPGSVQRTSDVFWLPRFLVRDWSGEEFAEKIDQFFYYQKTRPPISA
jgi:peptidoglycan/xylan/chitin deacetylase (PgdA/CDA1 family)